MSVEQYRELIRKHPHKPEKRKTSKATWEIETMLRLAGFEFEQELEFMKDIGRKFRFDFACRKLMIAIEYEGIHSEKSRHTTVTGFAEDCVKYRWAAILGWTVLRYTAKDYRDVVTDIRLALDQRTK